MAMDGELAEPRRGEVERHLSHCWECRGRRAQFERAIEEYLVVHQTMGADLSRAPATGPQARLRAALAHERDKEGERSFAGWTGLNRTWRPLAAGVALALLVPVSVWMWMSVRTGEAEGPLPDQRLTPGAVRFISKQQVCGVATQDEGRMVPVDLAARVFEQYRIANPKPRAYEVDYLISPALGGATALENLWPVPYADGVWTSRVKDALEDHLRNMVCDGKLNLATAQREIAADWIAAYRKYFRTRTPVAAHAHFLKDSPWE